MPSANEHVQSTVYQKGMFAQNLKNIGQKLRTVECIQHFERKQAQNVFWGTRIGTHFMVPGLGFTLMVIELLKCRMEIR